MGRAKLWRGNPYPFFDFNSEQGKFTDEGSRFRFSSFSHTIRFTRCTFTDIDGKDTDDEYRQTDGAAIIIHCPSSLVVEDCYFSNCGGGMNGGAIDIKLRQEQTTASITSTSFEECWTTSRESNVIHHRTQGIITLTSSNFTNYIHVWDSSRSVYSNGIIVSNCLFNYSGGVNYNALKINPDKSQLFFTSFSSNIQSDLDVVTTEHFLNLLSFVGCVSNSQQARSLEYFGLSPLTIEIVEEQVAVDPGNLQTALTDTNINLFYLGGGNYGAFEIEARQVQLKKWNLQNSLIPTAVVITCFSATVKAGAECVLSLFQLAPLIESSSLVSVFTQGNCSLRYVVIDQIDGLTVPLFSVTGADASFSLRDS
ncbi:hypothetical protein BLNAU_14708 [Blattamonas nauphoetae]|uniref:Right handed beta helix domain-containing protein n=1 Tax=Blattamonas nauphoetae TaxID=2049346 RepID=A0ABQ9XGC4_9EUKA|nr:hypothetical protein BLNAU_14708 [Blattamonas nauphoetae]